MRAPVVIEPAVRVESAVFIRIIASIYEGILILDDIALFVNPAAQHTAALVEGIGSAVNLLAEALALRAEALAVLAEVMPSAVAVGTVRILLAVNEDPGVSHHATVRVHIVIIAAEGKNAVL